MEFLRTTWEREIELGWVLDVDFLARVSTRAGCKSLLLKDIEAILLAAEELYEDPEGTNGEYPG